MPSGLYPGVSALKACTNTSSCRRYAALDITHCVVVRLCPTEVCRYHPAMEIVNLTLFPCVRLHTECAWQLQSSELMMLPGVSFYRKNLLH